MAFPGTLNISYYKGDTYEFRIYPKTADGDVFDLTPYVGGDYDDDNDPGTPVVDADAVVFSFAETRGEADPHKCFAEISDDKTYITCVIRPEDSQYLDAGTTYVYDVQIFKPADTETIYPTIHTLLTGNITVTGQVSQW
jgi:hypothetical protein